MAALCLDSVSAVADITKQISADYGVLLEDGPDIGVSLRGTFIIDPKQVVRHISINDLPVGRSVDEVLRLVDAFQARSASRASCPPPLGDTVLLSFFLFFVFVFVRPSCVRACVRACEGGTPS